MPPPQLSASLCAAICPCVELLSTNRVASLSSPVSVVGVQDIKLTFIVSTRFHWALIKKGQKARVVERANPARARSSSFFKRWWRRPHFHVVSLQVEEGVITDVQNRARYEIAVYTITHELRTAKDALNHFTNAVFTS